MWTLLSNGAEEIRIAGSHSVSKAAVLESRTVASYTN